MRKLLALLLLPSLAFAQPIPGTGSGSGGGDASAANQTTIIGHVDGLEGLLTTIDADTGNVATSTANIDTDTTTIIGHVDGLEGHVDGVEGLLATMDTDTGAIATSVAAIDTDTSTIIGHVDGLEALIGTTNTNTGNTATSVAAIDTDTTTIIGHVDGIEALIGTTNTNTGAATTALQIMDDWDESDKAKTVVKPGTTGGLTIFRSIDLDETEEDVKTSAGQLYGYYLFNAAASVRYFKFYNATAASVSVGTTTPVLTIPVPAGSAANVFTAIGVDFGTAITAACTTGIADADTGAPGANECVLNAYYN